MPPPSGCPFPLRHGEPAAASLAAVRGALRGPGPLADPLVHRPHGEPYKGFSIACYMLGYGVIRLFHRVRAAARQGARIRRVWIPDRPGQASENFYRQFTWFNFTTGQILNVLLVAVAVILMAVFSVPGAVDDFRPRDPAADRTQAPKEGEVTEGPASNGRCDTASYLILLRKWIASTWTTMPQPYSIHA